MSRVPRAPFVCLLTLRSTPALAAEISGRVLPWRWTRLGGDAIRDSRIASASATRRLEK